MKDTDGEEFLIPAEDTRMDGGRCMYEQPRRERRERREDADIFFGGGREVHEFL